MNIEVDFRYVEIDYELWALGKMLESIESMIETISRMDQEAVWSELRAQGWIDDDAERSLASQDISEMRDYVLPRFIRGGFLVSLWACYESATLNAGNQRAKEDQVSPPSRKRGRRDQKKTKGNVLDQRNEYFESTLRVPLEPKAGRFERLQDLYVVRNLMAHAHGQRAGAGNGDWDKLVSVSERRRVGVDHQRGLLVPTASYVRESYGDVSSSLTELVHRLRGGQPRGASA